jgi:hypothetical protein
LQGNIWTPPLYDEKLWKKYCLGYNEESLETTPTANPDIKHRIVIPTEGFEPANDMLIQLDQKTIFAVLKYHSNWISTDTGYRGYTWILALLTFATDLLMAEEIYLLRQLSRKCKEARSAVYDITRVHEDELDARILFLTMIICIVSDVYAQSDLRDEDIFQETDSGTIQRYSRADMYRLRHEIVLPHVEFQNEQTQGN